MSETKENLQARQAPRLIKEIKGRLGETQKTLAAKLKITQQAVSDYERGKVKRERYDILTKLQGMLADAPDVNEVEGDLKNYVRQAVDKETRKPNPTPTPRRKKKAASPVSTRRNAGT